VSRAQLAGVVDQTVWWKQARIGRNNYTGVLFNDTV
jgi:hypothetical protein